MADPRPENLLLAVLALAATAAAQARPDPAPDPFTKGDAAAMAALGIVAYGPFPWADDQATTDVDRVLGEGRIQWLETANFRIGCTLKAAVWPTEPAPRKELLAEVQRFAKKAKSDPSPKGIDAWLRLHLYAQRAEELHTAITGLLDTKAADRKTLILLFHNKSDLVRYHDRFCNGMKSELSQGYRHQKSGHHAVHLVVEDDEPRDEAAVHAQFRFLLTMALLDLHGTSLPTWCKRGVAHWHERQVTTNRINIAPRADEPVDLTQAHEWRQKLAARSRREELLLPFFRLATTTDLGYYGSLQAWSTVDFLLARDRTKFGRFLGELRTNGSSARQYQLLEEVFGLDVESIDVEWRKWVQKTYK